MVNGFLTDGNLLMVMRDTGRPTSVQIAGKIEEVRNHLEKDC